MPNYFDEKDIARLIKAQDKEIELYVANLVKEIDALLSQVTRQIKPDQSINELLGILNQLSTQNLPEKIKAKIRDSLALYQDRVSEIDEMFKQTTSLNIKLTADDKKLITSILETDVAVQLNTLDEVFNSYKQLTYRGILTNQIQTLPELQANVTKEVTGKLYTQTRTQLAQFQSALTVTKARDLKIKYFKYIGGLVKNSRKFCRDRDGLIFSYEDILKMDNGQGLPVITSRGGYNCGHRWVPVLEESALRQGVARGF